MTDLSKEALIQIILELRQANTVLAQTVAALEEELQRFRNPKNSSNSSIPPSKDENRPLRTQSLRIPSGKKPGGQIGHKGSTLDMSQTPDEIIISKPESCTACGESLQDVCGEVHLRRQEFDLPPPKVRVVEYQTYRKVCRCGQSNQSAMPAHIKAPVQYGSHVETLVIYLHTRQYMPYRRLTEVLEHCFGVRLSEGTIENIIRRFASKSEPYYEYIRQQIQKAEAVGGDESSVRVDGDLGWYWAFQTKLFAYLLATNSRGFEVIDQVFPKGLPNTVFVHDAWKSYFQTKVKGHQLCLAHLLRELKYLIEISDNHAWPLTCQHLFRTALDLKDRFTTDSPDQAFIEARQKLEDGMDLILHQLPPPKQYKDMVRIANRLIKHRDAIFPFLYHRLVPPDNNGSERAIRNLKVKLKISGQFKTWDAAQHFATIRSVIDTFIKQGKPLIPNLHEIAKLTFQVPE